MTYFVEDICSFEKLEDLLPQVLASMATRNMVKGSLEEQAVSHLQSKEQQVEDYIL